MKRLHSFSNDLRDLKSVSREIEAFEVSSSSEELASLESRRQKLIDSRSRKSSEYNELKPKLDTLKKTLDDQERHQRMLDDNISILRSMDRVKELSSEIEELLSQRDEVGSRDHLEQYNSFVDKRELLKQEKARTDGKFSSHVEQIRAIKVRMK